MFPDVPPIVSVIIPTYNATATIERALASVADQTFELRQIEVIIVDDASTDGTPELLERLCRRYPFCTFECLRKYSRGGGKPRNIALSRARGDYIMFLDADDEYEPDACAVLVGAMESTGADTVSSEYRIVGTGESLRKPGIFQNPVYDTILGVRGAEHPELFWSPPAMWSRIYRRLFLQENKISLPEEVLGQDAVFVIHALLVAETVHHLRFDSYRYHRDQDESVASVSYWLDPQFFRDFLETRRMIEVLFSAYSDIAYRTVRAPIDIHYALRRWLEHVRMSGFVDPAYFPVMQEIAGLSNERPTLLFHETEVLLVDFLSGGYENELREYLPILLGIS